MVINFSFCFYSFYNFDEIIDLFFEVKILGLFIGLSLVGLLSQTRLVLLAFHGNEVASVVLYAQTILVSNLSLTLQRTVLRKIARTKNYESTVLRSGFEISFLRVKFLIFLPKTHSQYSLYK